MDGLKLKVDRWWFIPCVCLFLCAIERIENLWCGGWMCYLLI
jgi:hypothetical protein